MHEVLAIFEHQNSLHKRYRLPIRFRKHAQYLTRKEAKILLMLMEGQRTKEIAWHLELSQHTVNTHLANIKAKLGCNSMFQLGVTLGELRTFYYIKEG